MSSPSPASRSLLGALALASALVLTACAGEEQAGAAPENGAVSAASAAASDAGTSPGDGTGDTAGDTAEPAEGRTGEPTGAEPAESRTAEDPVEEPAAAEDGADGAGGADDDTPRENGTASGGGTDGTPSGDGSALCTTSQLEVAAAPVGGAAGSVHVDVVVTNAGESPCTLAGYAGVSFVDATGTMIGSPAVRDAAVPGTGRVVAPGESVSAGLRMSQAGNHPTCDARTAAGLRVYPPENTESVVIPFPVEACGDPQIHQLEIQGFGA